MQDFYNTVLNVYNAAVNLFIAALQAGVGLPALVTYIGFIIVFCYAIKHTVVFLINVCYFVYMHIREFCINMYWDYKYKDGIFTKRKAK